MTVQPKALIWAHPATVRCIPNLNVSVKTTQLKLVTIDRAKPIYEITSYFENHLVNASYVTLTLLGHVNTIPVSVTLTAGIALMFDQAEVSRNPSRSLS